MADAHLYYLGDTPYPTAAAALAAYKSGDDIWLGDQEITSTDLKGLAEEEAVIAKEQGT